MRTLLLTTAIMVMTGPAFAGSQETADYSASSAAAIEPAGYADENRKGIATSRQIIKKLTAEKTDSDKFISPNIDLSIKFKPGSAKLDDTAWLQLRELAEALENPDLLYADIVIEGHTDNVGSEALNKNLSKRRAEAVASALQTKYGIDTKNIGVKGFGESRPVTDNSTEAARAKNRRVTIVRVN